MKAILINNYGGPDVLQLTEVNTPCITDPSQVLVKVRATSVNPLDYQVRRGDYASSFDLPIITGHDISGEVIAVGESVKKWQPGDKVYYSPRFGGPGSYAEYHLTDEASLSRMPLILASRKLLLSPLLEGRYGKCLWYGLI